MFQVYIIIMIIIWVSGLIWFLGFWFNYGVSQSTHKVMTRDDSKMQVVGTYQDFVRQFYLQEWPDKNPTGSFFNRKTDSTIHASIIKFNGVGMIMKNMFHFYLVCRFLHKHPIEKLPSNYWRLPPEMNNSKGDDNTC